MIDFPVGTTAGQTFVASNGVVYMWTGTIWVASGVSTTPGGDFCANQTSSFPTLTAAYAVLKPTQILSGNSGSWYSSSTGRYTPPAGRYFIHAGFTASTATVGGQNFMLQLRKNNVVTQTTGNDGNEANFYGTPAVSIVVDANGTDYFDIWGLGEASNNTMIALWFLAYPISGIKGAPGDPGVSGGGGDIPVGGIVDFAGANAPAGWLLCNGQSVTTAAFGALFTAIGYTFGGAGANFNVPDLGGRVTAGKELTAGGVRLTAAGAGIIGSTLGAAGGTQTHPLTIAQLASHTHLQDDHYHGVGSNDFSYTPGGGGPVYSVTTYPGLSIWAASMATAVNQSTGSGTAHQNTQPTIVMNKIIKT